MGRTTIDELPRWARGLLEEARVARLGLLDDEGGPRVLPVTFVLHEGGLWTAVDQKPKRDPGREPARVGFLRRDPRAALTVDRYDDDWSRLAWVQILGDVTVLAVDDAPEALAALTTKYPQYGGEPPPGPLLRVDPLRALCWSAGSTG
ncbi:MAG: pyridoxamine 5'-phosphate oxidase family protein [Solirubrobacterales bacterium]